MKEQGNIFLALSVVCLVLLLPRNGFFRWSSILIAQRTFACTGMGALFFFILKNRSSHRRCSVRKSVLRNFAKFTGKHLCQGLFFNKVAGLPKKVFLEISQNSQGNTCARVRPATLFKKTLAQVFSCEFCELSKNAFFKEHLWTTASDRFNVGCFFRCLLWPT